MGTLTMKFGGSSVGTTAALTQVASIVLQAREHWDRIIIVVAALDGVTDALIEAVQLARLSNRRGYRRIVATIRTRHLALIDKLALNTETRSAIQADLDQILFDMLDTCQMVSDDMVDTSRPENTDAIIGVGEQLSARIIAAVLGQNGIRAVPLDTTGLIITESRSRSARVDMTKTRSRIQEHILPMLEREIIPVITGFIAGTPAGKPTTLGRGGSDYTASIVSVLAGAEELWMWTAYDGIMSSDPGEIQGTRVIPELSYDEAAELAYFGARILHTRMIDPLRNHNIPLYIRNVFKPQLPGTRVQFTSNQHPPHISGVTQIQGIALSAPRSGNLAPLIDLIHHTLKDNESLGIDLDVMITSQSSHKSLVCFVIPTSTGPDAPHLAQSALKNKLEHEGMRWDVFPIAIITAVGPKLTHQPNVIAQIFQAVDESTVLAIALSPAECAASIVVSPDDSHEVLTRIHRLTVGQPNIE